MVGGAAVTSVMVSVVLRSGDPLQCELDLEPQGLTQATFQVEKKKKGCYPSSKAKNSRK